MFQRHLFYGYCKGLRAHFDILFLNLKKKVFQHFSVHYYDKRHILKCFYTLFPGVPINMEGAVCPHVQCL